MSDPSHEALLAWCESRAKQERPAASVYAPSLPTLAQDYIDSAKVLEALAALVRAQQTLRAEVEKLRSEADTFHDDARYNGYQSALDDVLRLLPARR